MRFKVVGIPVTVQWSFVLSAGLLGYGRMEEPLRLAAWIAVVFTGVLLHELGHALVWRRFGHSPVIELQWLGGLTRGDEGKMLPPGRAAIVALAGPFAGGMLALAALTLLLSGVVSPRSFGGAFLADVWFANKWWTIFNLLPILPLDGGAVVAAINRKFNGDQPPRFAYAFSIPVAVAVCIWAVMKDAPIAAFFVAGYALQAYQALGAIKQYKQHAPHPQTPVAMAMLRDGKLNEARAAAEEVLRASDKDMDIHLALHVLATVHTRQGRPDEALNLLHAMPRGLTAHALVLGEAWDAKGEHLKASAFFRDAFREAPGRETALRYARSLLKGGLTEELNTLLTSGASLTYSDDTCAGLQDALFEAARYEESARVGAHRHQAFGSAAAAYNAACALAKLGRAEDGLRWLSAAVDRGFKDAGHLLTDPDLEPLRALAGFDAVRRRVEGGVA